MKKLLLVVASLVIATGLMAEPKAGQAIFTIYAGAGATITGGTVDATGYSSAESGTGTSTEFGLQLGYFVSDGFAFLATVDYAAQPMVIEYGSPNMKITVKSNFIEMGLGLRGYSGGLFYGAGLYYGMKNPSQWEAEASDGATGTIKLTEKYCKDVFGVSLELGYAFFLTDAVSLDLSMKYKLQASYAWDTTETAGEVEKLKSNAFNFNLGLSFFF